MFILRYLRKIFSLISLISGIVLLLGVASVYINPSISVLPAFFGLAYPIVYLLNIGLMIFAFFNKKKWVIYHAIVLLLGAQQIHHYINLYPSKTTKTAGEIKIISYNVRSFNRYSWLDKSNIKGKIESLLKQENADIICFQEFHLKGKNDSARLRAMVKKLGMKYYLSNNLNGSEDVSGLVIFSKYPLKKVLRENFHQQIFGGNGLLIADVLLPNKTWRIANFHLESIRLEYNDYAYAKNPTEDKEKVQAGAMRIIKRFIKAYGQRGRQVDTLAKLLQDSQYPVVAAGDANDPPVSYTYQVLSKNLTDTFKEKGNMGTGATYAGKLPSFRIDYIFSHYSINTTSHKVLPIELSDHYPIIATLK